MGSLIEELERREAAARVEADRLRSRIEELAEDLARAEGQVSRLAIAREEVARVLEDPAGDWDQIVASHQPPNVLLVAVGEADAVIGYVAAHPDDGEMFLLFVHPARPAAAARKLLTCVFYAMRDGEVRSLVAPAPRARDRVSRPGHGQRMIARRSGPRPGRRGCGSD